MSDEFVTTAPPIQQSPADKASSDSIDAYLSHKPAAEIERTFSRASVEHRRSAPPENEAIGIGAARATEAAPSTMPPAPAVTSESNAAVEKLYAMGGEHAELVRSWQGDAATNIEYARESFRELVASDPGLVEAVDRAGIGSHPAILQHLARFGRLSANLMGDNTIADRSRPSPAVAPPRGTPSFGGNRGSEETQNELNELYRANPPGSPSYKNVHVQNRIRHLNEILAGSGSPVGIGGRTA